MWPDALGLAERAGPTALFRGLRSVLERDYVSVPDRQKAQASTALKRSIVESIQASDIGSKEHACFKSQLVETSSFKALFICLPVALKRSFHSVYVPLPFLVALFCGLRSVLESCCYY